MSPPDFAMRVWIDPDDLADSISLHAGEPRIMSFGDDWMGYRTTWVWTCGEITVELIDYDGVHSERELLVVAHPQGASSVGRAMSFTAPDYAACDLAGRVLVGLAIGAYASRG